MTEGISIYILWEFVAFTQQDFLTLLDLVKCHLFSFCCENFDKLFPTNFSFLRFNSACCILSIFIVLNDIQGIINMAFSDSINRAVIYEELKEHIEVKFIHCLFEIFHI